MLHCNFFASGGVLFLHLLRWSARAGGGGDNISPRNRASGNTISRFGSAYTDKRPLHTPTLPRKGQGVRNLGLELVSKTQV